MQILTTAVENITAVVSRILTNYLPQFRDQILFFSTTQ